MRVLGISSSPRYEGNTARLVRSALAGARRSGAEVEEIHLPAVRLEHCRGCLTCMSTGQCVIQDDFGPLKQKLLAAHGLILGSPTYALAPNARMKVFLERMGTFWVYSSLLSDKYIVGLSTAGGMGARSVARSLTGLVNGFFGSGKISGTLGVLVGDGDVPPVALARAETLGRRLVADIASQRRYRLQQPVARVIRWVAASAMARPNVLKGREDRMKAVYEVLVARGRVRRRM